MHRTQLYIDRDLYEVLATEADRDGTTISEVVRSRLRRALRIRPQRDALTALDRAVGIWARRSDLPATGRYVRTLRRSTRRTRYGIAQPQDRRR